MSADRGEYRSIRRVLLDGPDFQQLPERARWVFVTLKLNMGPSGIDVVYPAALLPQLAAQTGATSEQVSEALDSLEESGWIHREGNLLWVVGQLENDPHLSPTDKKHRTSVARHLGSLPRLPLIRAFIAAHPAFFPSSDDRPEALLWAFVKAKKGQTRAIEGPTKGHRRAIEAGSRKEGEGKREVRAADAATPPTDVLPKATMDAAYDAWTETLGSVNYGRFRKALLPIFEAKPQRFSAPELIAAVGAFEEGRSTDNPKWRQKWNPEKFAAELPEWVRLGQMELTDDYGLPTERGRASGIFGVAS